jgi:D-alanine-D-alanine ligase
MDITNPREYLPVLMLCDIDRSLPPIEIHESEEITEIFVGALRAIGHSVTLVYLESNNLQTLLKPFDPKELIVFNWCEEVPGVPHSSSLVAWELEQRGFTFTGSDYYALALGTDKRRIKQRLLEQGIPTPEWQVYTSVNTINWSQFPAIVKPAFEHCGIGITREAVVQSREDLIARICYILKEFHQPALVEDFIDGREFHVGVIGNGNARVLPPAEIDFSSLVDIHDRLCTYEANFDKHSLAYQKIITRLPALLTPDQQRNLEDVVLAAYRATDCRDYARMDVRLRNDIFYILDVNHNADISPDNSLILAVELVGYNYGQFGSLLINLATQRHTHFPYWEFT